MKRCSVLRLAVVVLCLLAVFGFWAGLSWAAEAPILKTFEGKEKVRVAGLIEAARKEGKLVWGTNALNIDTCKVLEKTFKELYGLPNLDINLTYETAAVISRRVETEIRADKVTEDVILVATPVWYSSLHRRKEILPYESPEDKAYGVSFKQNLSAQGYWVSERLQIQTIAWNPAMLPGVKITSWYDLLDPRLRGKIIVGDVGRGEPMALAYIAHRKVLPEKYYEDLNKQQVTLFMRSERIRQSLIAGEFAATTNLSPRHVYTTYKEGAPLEICYPKEGIAALPLGSLILAKAPHPNAAKLFIDFIRSVRGLHITTEHNPFPYTRANMPPHPNPKVQELFAKVAPPIEKINIVPMDYLKITPDEVKKGADEFVSIFGVGKD
jgi:iron(III) transport system substrate-binding protein